MVLLAHGSLLHPFEGMTQFGSDWWYVVAPLLVVAAGAAALHRTGADPGRVRDRHVRRIAAGAGRLTGLPDWAAVTMLTLIGFLPILAMGFFFDVTWHVDLGRDEYLLSPPHVLLALGVGPGFAGAGLVGVIAATRTRADVLWRWRGPTGTTWRVPISSAFLLLATAVATVGWGVDELWHMMYGLDVTMWSPTHMGMIGSAFLLGAATWAMLGEAGLGEAGLGEAGLGEAGGLHRTTRTGRALLVVIAGAVLVAFSSVQLEYDLGIQQWQLLHQPLLIVLAAGLALPPARLLLGRGGAIAAAGVFVAVRLALAVTVDHVWHFSVPRFPLYLASAVAVEGAFLLFRDRRRRLLASGVGIATIGLAGEWAWTTLDGAYVGLPHTWQLGLFPGLLWALPVALAAAALGLTFGATARGWVTGMRRAGLAVALGVIVLGLAVPAARIAPDAEVEVRTAAVAHGLVDVIVVPEVPGAHDGAERFEVFSWQGGADPTQTSGHGRLNVALLSQPDGTYRSAAPVPVGGQWKSMVLLNDGPTFGAVAVYLPHDEEYGLPEVPVADSRTGPFEPASQLLMREVDMGGALWVDRLAYVVLAIGLGLEIWVLSHGIAGLDARRRTAADTAQRPGAGDLQGCAVPTP